MEDVNQTFFTTLLYLGFDPEHMEAKHQIKFHKDMFLKPNRKAFEVVSHFLFFNLDPVLCKERFRSCWPIFDKKQEREFRKACCDWLKDISIEYSEARFPQIVPSIFLSPGGDKFCILYLSFSRYVLKKVIIRENSSQYLLHMPSFSPEYSKASATILQISTDNSIRNFLKLQEISQQQHQMWHKCSREMMSIHKSLKKRIAEKEELLKQKREMLSSSVCENICNLKLNDKENQKAQVEKFLNIKKEKTEKVCKMWKSLENFKDKEKDYWEVLKSVINDDNSSRTLEGELLNFHIPDSFLQECREELLQKGITKTFKNGKVDINSILGIWNVYLKFQQKKLKDAKLPDAKVWIPILKDYSESHVSNLHILQELSLKLNMEHLPGIGNSLNNLDEIYNSYNQNSTINIQEHNFQLCAQTPEFSFSPSENQDQSVLPSRVFSLSPTMGSSSEIIIKKERKYIRSPLLNDPLCSPDLKDSNNRRKSPVIQLEKVGQKQRTKVIWYSNDHSSNENLPSPSFRKVDYYSSTYNHINRCLADTSINISNSKNEPIVLINGEKFCTVDVNVKNKFAERIVESVLDGSESDSFENAPSYSVDNSTPDLFEQSAFITRDKLKRTPTDNTMISNSQQCEQDIDSSTTNANILSRSLNNSIQEMQFMFDEIFISDGKNSELSSKDLLNMSWNEEELLTKVTMPEVPLLDIADDSYNRIRDDHNFSSVLMQYKNLKDTSIFMQE